MEPARRARLVRTLAALSEDERRRVLVDARAEAAGSQQERPAGPTLPWASLRAAIGVVHGAPADALEDCDHLYDG